MPLFSSKQRTRIKRWNEYDIPKDGADSRPVKECTSPMISIMKYSVHQGGLRAAPCWFSPVAFAMCLTCVLAYEQAPITHPVSRDYHVLKSNTNYNYNYNYNYNALIEKRVMEDFSDRNELVIKNNIVDFGRVDNVNERDTAKFPREAKVYKAIAEKTETYVAPCCDPGPTEEKILSSLLHANLEKNVQFNTRNRKKTRREIDILVSPHTTNARPANKLDETDNPEWLFVDGMDEEGMRLNHLERIRKPQLAIEPETTAGRQISPLSRSKLARFNRVFSWLGEPTLLTLGIVGNSLLVVVFLITPLRLRVVSHTLAAAGICDLLYTVACLLMHVASKGARILALPGACQIITFTLILSQVMATWCLFFSHLRKSSQTFQTSIMSGHKYLVSGFFHEQCNGPLLSPPLFVTVDPSFSSSSHRHSRNPAMHRESHR